MATGPGPASTMSRIPVPVWPRSELSTGPVMAAGAVGMTWMCRYHRVTREPIMMTSLDSLGESPEHAWDTYRTAIDGLVPADCVVVPVVVLESRIGPGHQFAKVQVDWASARPVVLDS